MDLMLVHTATWLHVWQPDHHLGWGALQKQIRATCPNDSGYTESLDITGEAGCPQYIEYKHTKTSVLDPRDVMPSCVLRVSLGDLYNIQQLTMKVWSFQEVRGWFPNPLGVPYTDFEPSSRFTAWVIIVVVILRCTLGKLLYTLTCTWILTLVVQPPLSHLLVPIS